MIGQEVELSHIRILLNPRVSTGLIWCYQVHKLTSESLEGFPFTYCVWSFNGRRDSTQLQVIPIQEMVTQALAMRLVDEHVARRRIKGYDDEVFFNWETGRPFIAIPGLPIPAALGRQTSTTITRAPRANRNNNQPSIVESETSTYAYLT